MEVRDDVVGLVQRAIDAGPKASEAVKQAASAGIGQEVELEIGAKFELPALQRAGRMIEKVTKVGFQWSEASGPLDKISEELGELRVEALALDQAIRSRAKPCVPGSRPTARSRITCCVCVAPTTRPSGWS